MSNGGEIDLDPHVLIAILAVVLAVLVLGCLFAWLNADGKPRR